MPFFSLAAFTGGPQKLAADPAVSSMANKHGVTPSQVALAWLLPRTDRPDPAAGRPAAPALAACRALAPQTHPRTAL